MSDDRVRLHFQRIQQQIVGLQTGNIQAWQEINAALEELHVIYEQMQACLEEAEATKDELSQQNYRMLESYQHYCNLFQFSPIAYLVTDANGLILEASHEAARLLNVSQSYLAEKPLFLYIPKDDRFTFYMKLSQLSHQSSTQVWQMNVCPRNGEPIVTEWHITTTCGDDGRVKSVRIGMYDLSHYQQTIAPLTQQQDLTEVRAEKPATLQLPRSLDGLQVLVVDDEADIREFITTVLESHGIAVRAVASAAAALKMLEQFKPDILLSDIRMPDGDGYDLIRQIRNLEVAQGGHIPAGAITAYQQEDREKALTAGFEAHLYKLAQPAEWVEMVVQLAGRAG